MNNRRRLVDAFWLLSPLWPNILIYHHRRKMSPFTPRLTFSNNDFHRARNAIVDEWPSFLFCLFHRQHKLSICKFLFHLNKQRGSLRGVLGKVSDLSCRVSESCCDMILAEHGGSRGPEQDRRPGLGHDINTSLPLLQTCDLISFAGTCSALKPRVIEYSTVPMIRWVTLFLSWPELIWVLYSWEQSSQCWSLYIW